MASKVELDYLRQALAQKRANNAQGNPTIVQGNSLATAQNQTALNTDFQEQPVTPDFNTTETSNNSGNGFETFWDGLLSGWNSFEHGVLSAFEGIGDFVLTGASAIGSAFGADMTDLNNYIAKDISQSIADFNQAYGQSMGNLGFMANLFSGKVNGDYFSNYFKDLGQIGLSMVSNAEQATMQNQFQNGYYGNHYRERGTFEQIIDSGAETIGRMLPSILTGQAVAGGVASIASSTPYLAEVATMGAEALGKAASLAQMGVSVAGTGAQEALQNGATSHQALASGLVKGVAEVASEIVVGKALDGIAQATGLSKVIGKFGNTPGGAWLGTKEIITKGSIKEIAKSMVEEGSEEIFSEVFEPFANAFYGKNGSNYGERLLSNLQNKEWGKDLATAFAGGAVMGGFFTGVTRYKVRQKVGFDGLNAIDTINEVNEASAEIQENLESGKITQQEAVSQMEKVAEKVKTLPEQLEKMNDTQKANFTELIGDPEQFAQQIKDNTKVNKTSDNSYSITLNGGRKFDITEQGNETVFTPKTADFGRAADVLATENIPADSVQLTATFTPEDGMAETKPLTFPKGVVENCFDDGISKQDLNEVATAIKDGDFSTKYIDSGKTEITLTTKTGNTYKGTVNENGGTYTVENLEMVSQVEQVEKVNESATAKKHTNNDPHLTVRGHTSYFGDEGGLEDAFSSLEELLYEALDDTNYTEQTDYRESHINGKFVVRVNKACDAIVSYLVDDYFDGLELEGFENASKEQVALINEKIEKLTGLATEDFMSLLENIQNEVGNAEWVNEPDMGYIESLQDFLSDYTDGASGKYEDLNDYVSGARQNVGIDENTVSRKPKNLNITAKADEKSLEIYSNKQAKVERLAELRKQRQEERAKHNSTYHEAVANQDVPQKTLKEAAKERVVDFTTVKDGVKDIVSNAFVKTEKEGAELRLGEDLNSLSKKLTAAVDRSIDATEAIKAMNDMTDEALNEAWVKIDNETKGQFADGELDKLKASFHALNERIVNNASKSQQRKAIDELKTRLEKIEAKAKNFHDAIKQTKDLSKASIKLGSKYGFANEAITSQEDIRAHNASVMVRPFVVAEFSDTGMTANDFVPAVEELLKEYNRGGEGGHYAWEEQEFGYIPEIADLMQEIVDTFPKTGTLDAEQMKKANELRKLIEARISQVSKQASKDYTRSVAAREQTLAANKQGGFNNKLQEGWWSFNAIVHSPETTIINTTGSQVVADAIRSIDDGYWLKVSNLEAVRTQTQDFFDKQNIKSSIVSKEIEYKGHKITIDQALWWLTQLNADEESINYIDASNGLWIKGDGKTNVKIKFEAEDVENNIKGTAVELEELIDAKAKQTGFAQRCVNYLNKVYNGKFKADYIEMQKAKFGGIETNALVGDYLPATPYTNGRTIGQPVVKETRVFGNSKSRVARHNSAGLRGEGAFTYFDSYADNLYNDMYVKPRTSELTNIFETLLDTKNKEKYKDLFTSKFNSVVDQYVKQVTGAIKPMNAGILAKGVVTATLTNPQTFLIQTASYATSGTNLSTMFFNSAPINLYARAMVWDGNKGKTTFTSKIPTDMQSALGQVIANAPEYKLRMGGNEAYLGNINGTVNNPLEKVGEVLSSPINYFDRVTVNKILVASLYTARQIVANTNNVEVGKVSFSDPEVVKVATTIARTNYKTQISSAAIDRSPLRFGVIPWAKENSMWGSPLGKMLIGATRAYTGAAQGFIDWWSNSLGEMRRFHGYDINKAETAIDETIQEIDLARADASDIQKEGDTLQRELKSLRDQRKLAKKELEKSNYKSLKVQDAIDKLDADINKKQAEIKGNREEYNKAQRKVETTEGKLQSLESTRDGYKLYVAKGGSKKMVSSLIGGTILMGIFTQGLREFFDRVKDKKEWDEWNFLEIGKDIVVNSTIGMLPIIRSFVSLAQGYSVEDPGVSVIYDCYNLISQFRSALTNPTSYNIKTTIRKAVELGSSAFGIPTKNIWTYFSGIVGQINPTVILEAKSLIYNASVDNSDIVELLAKGDYKNAYAYMDYKTKDTVGTLSNSVKEEMANLLVEGHSVLPSAFNTTYTDINGKEVNISWTNQQKIKSHYSKANAQLTKLIASAYYKQLSSEAKAKAIQAIYQAYKQGAYQKVLGSAYQGQTTKASLLSKTNANVGSIIAAVKGISELVATKTKTRKELAIAYINRLPLSKQEKMIALYMAGFSVDSSYLKTALKTKGMSNDDIKAFLGDKK